MAMGGANWKEEVKMEKLEWEVQMAKLRRARWGARWKGELQNGKERC